MSVLFVHDHVFLRKDSKVYSNTFSQAVLQAYAEVFSHITVLARCRDIEDITDTCVPQGEGIHFELFESISGVSSYLGLRQRQHKRMEALVAAHDVVIARLPSELGLMAAAVARRLHKPYMLEVVGCAWDAMWNYGGVQSRVYAPFLYGKVRFAVSKANYVSYVTEQFLQRRYPARPSAHTLGVSDVVLPVLDEVVLARRIARIKEQGGPLIFAAIANMHVLYKGVDVALNALARMQAEYGYSDFKFRILGAGDPAPYLALANRLGIADRVFFDGVRSGGESVFNWLDEVDIYLQFSRLEGLPRALIEAMSRGCPAVGASVGGIPELLAPQMLFDHANPARASELLYRLASNRTAMLIAAKQNFEVAGRYQKHILEDKRKNFWMRFRDESG